MDNRFEQWFHSQDWSDEDIPKAVFKATAFSAWSAAVAAEREWINVKERLPKGGLPVIACGLNEYGRIRRIRAAWVEKYSIEDEHDEYLVSSDYCTEKDKFYWPEGWYEWNEVEETHWIVPFEILYWKPLPEPPESIRKRGE